MDDAAHRKYFSLPKLIVTAMATQSHEHPDVDSQPVSDLVAGDMLVFTEKRSDFYHVSYPDGRKAWVAVSDALPVPDWLENIRLTGESIVATARKFVGVPYLWGGTSAKSVDCSGFVKSVYFMHGIILARDASQQARYGKLVDTAGDFSKPNRAIWSFLADAVTNKIRRKCGSCGNIHRQQPVYSCFRLCSYQ